MKRLIAYVVLLHALPIFGQCTFERINQNYVIETNTDRSITLYNDNIGFVNVVRVFQDSLFFPDGNRMLFIYQTDLCGNQTWKIEDNEVFAGSDYASVVNNIVKDSEGNYYVVSTDAGRFQSLITKYNAAGQRIKREYLSKTNLPLHYTENVKLFPFGQDKLILFGQTQDGLIWPEKPLIIVMDKSLNIIKQKIYEYNEYSNIPSSDYGIITDLFFTDKNYFYGYFYGFKGGANFGGNFLVKLDSNLTVLRSIALPRDTIKDYSPYYTCFNKEKNEFSCFGQIELTTEDRRKLAFWKADTSGNITYIKRHNPETDYPVFSMSPTNDGGFVCYPHLLKLDSNFNVEWYKPTKGTLTSITQLPDGGYIGSGVSNYLTTTWGDTNMVRYYQPYLIRTDSKGNYAPLSVEEQPKQNIKNNAISFYPNPATTTLTITGAANASMVIVDIMGRVVEEKTLKTNNFNIEHIPNGIYIINLTLADGNVYSQKVVVQHE